MNEQGALLTSEEVVVGSVRFWGPSCMQTAKRYVEMCSALKTQLGPQEYTIFVALSVHGLTQYLEECAGNGVPAPGVLIIDGNDKKLRRVAHAMYCPTYLVSIGRVGPAPDALRGLRLQKGNDGSFDLIDSIDGVIMRHSALDLSLEDLACLCALRVQGAPVRSLIRSLIVERKSHAS